MTTGSREPAHNDTTGFGSGGLVNNGASVLVENGGVIDGTLDLSVGAGYASTAQDGDIFAIIEWESFSGAIALLGLGVAGVAITRRRRRG